jgi:antitoxin component YwqK of YwqJK toxin-antitoxin module
MRYFNDMMRCFLFVVLFFAVCSSTAVSVYAQVPGDETEGEFEAIGDADKDFSLIRESPLTVDLEREKELAEDQNKDKKKKRKKKVFYGVKTRKGFTRRGVGDRVEVEIFYYLKESQAPDPYVPEVWWYERGKKTVRSTGFDPKRGVMLHGPYKRLVGEQIVEEGIFYLGAKHGRWTEYDRNNVLLDKRKYYKGWPKESLVRYYDVDKKKLKEVIPIRFGEKEGTYMYFHENGTVGIRGKYEEDVKVGVWTEYYPFRRRRKKEIQYREDPWDEAFKAYISREWNRRGQLVYERVY